MDECDGIWGERGETMAGHGGLGQFPEKSMPFSQRAACATSTVCSFQEFTLLHAMSLPQLKKQAALLAIEINDEYLRRTQVDGFATLEIEAGLLVVILHFHA